VVYSSDGIGYAHLPQDVGFVYEFAITLVVMCACACTILIPEILVLPIGRAGSGDGNGIVFNHFFVELFVI
jgi:hypothetical protein